LWSSYLRSLLGWAAGPIGSPSLARLFGHSTGGRPGEQLMKRLAIPASNDTILRHLKRHVAKNHVGAALRVAKAAAFTR
jgi:hypothetical protein